MCDLFFALPSNFLPVGPLFFLPGLACFEFFYPALEFVNEDGLGLGYASPTGLLFFLPRLAAFQLANPRLLSGPLFFQPDIACFEFSYPTLEFVNEGGLGLGYASPTGLLGFLPYLALFQLANPRLLSGLLPYLASCQALPVSSSPIQLLSS